MNEIALQFTPLIVLVAGTAVGLTLLVFYAWRRGLSAPGAWAFLALVILTAWWCYTYSLELMTADPATMLLWIKLQWISIPLIPVVWLLFALFYAGYGHRVTLRLVAALLIVPFTMILLAWTVPAHEWLYVDPGVRDVGRIVVFDTGYGPAFIVHTLYSYSLFLAATVLIVRVWRRGGEQRQLALTVTAGAILPFIGNAIYLLAPFLGIPLYVDLTVLAFAFSAVFFAWGWFRLRLFTVFPEFAEPIPGAGRIDPAVAAQNTQTRSLNLVSIGMALLYFLALVPILTILLRGDPAVRPLAILYVALYLVVLGIAIWRGGPYPWRAAGLTGVYLLLGLLDLRVSGLYPTVGFFLVAYAAFAAVLLPVRLMWVVFAAGILGVAVVPPALDPPIQRDIYSLAYLLLTIAMTAGMLIVALVATRRDNRTLLSVSRNLARELEKERTQLEARVVERTRALETSAAVSRQLSTILDQSRLVREVVEQLHVAFAYYHVHVYLWDESIGALRMVGGTGEAGQAMLVMGHTMRPDTGLVGRAYSTNAPVVVPDVNADAGWLPNRLLPGTRAEIAVPITYGDEVLGVLDAQDSEVGGLGPADSQLLQTIAGQLAVALRNARLVAQVQREAEQEALINAINRKIAQTTDIDGALRVAAAELSRALEVQENDVRVDLAGENGHDR
jgi:putative methionine-R-sulfoxide reductase with GAF domain